MFLKPSPLLVALALIVAQVSSSTVTVKVTNLCNETITVTSGSEFQPPTPFTGGLAIESQQSVSADFSNFWLGAFYANRFIKSGISFVIHLSPNNSNFYRVFIADEDSYSIEVVPPQGCESQFCSGYPCNVSTIECDIDGEYAINFCATSTNNS